MRRVKRDYLRGQGKPPRGLFQIWKLLCNSRQKAEKWVTNPLGKEGGKCERDRPLDGKLWEDCLGICKGYWETFIAGMIILTTTIDNGT